MVQARDAIQECCGCDAAGRHSGEQVADFVASRIARFKRPHLVEFTDALPRTADGSVDRQAVKVKWG